MLVAILASAALPPCRRVAFQGYRVSQVIRTHFLSGHAFAPITAQMSISPGHHSVVSDKLSVGFADMNMRVRRE